MSIYVPARARAPNITARISCPSLDSLILLISLYLLCSITPAHAQATTSSVISSGEPFVSTQAVQETLVVRLSRTDSKSIVPLTLDDQRILVDAFKETFKSERPMQMVTYRDGYPEPGSPDTISGSVSYVDICVMGWLIPQNTTALEGPSLGPGRPAPQRPGWRAEFENLLLWTAAVVRMGLPIKARLMLLNFGSSREQTPVKLAPLVVLQTLLAADVRNGAVSSSSSSLFLSAIEASKIEETLRENLIGGEVVAFVQVTSTDTETLQATYKSAAPAALQNSSYQKALLEVEITVYACEGPKVTAAQAGGCEEAAARAALEQVLTTAADAPPQTGSPLEDATVLAVRRRAPPELPTPLPSNTPWVPWHLDALDQRSTQQLDGKWTATADGSGVNIYLISSGIRASHQEFGHSDGSPGSRVKDLWGYGGLDPTQDCTDGRLWYSFGTYAASMIAGLTVGVARNATLHSVRMRESCILDNPDVWSPGGLPSALDAVLSTFQRPGVVVIDTWWSRERFATDDDDYIEAALIERLEKAAKADIPIFVPAGIGLGSHPPCDNIFSKGSSVIRVASVDDNQHASIAGPSNSSCIDIWAPGGGLAAGIIGADAGSSSAFNTVMPGAFGASWLVAGIAAQILQFSPNKTTTELRAALGAMAKPDVVIGAGEASANLLAFTNLTKQGALVAGENNNDGGGSGGGLSTGVIAAILVPLVLIGVLGFGALLFARRRRRAPQAALLKPTDSNNRDDNNGSSSSPSNNGQSHEWEIRPEQIQLLYHTDGTPYVLGRGQWGEVQRAMKDGLQAVAVKTLRREEARRLSREAFAQEIAMMQWLSRDANIVQFYGACVRHGTMMLVTELMEGGDLRAALSADISGDLGWYRGGKGVALDVARGLHFLHSHAVVHRDIKSKNILLTRDGRAKLGDVGLATIMEGEEGRKNGFSGGGGGVGTFSHMAPEMVLGLKFTSKADIYSFGVMLWEIVTHEIPIRGALRMPRVPEECPQGVSDIIVRCMQTNPEQRPTAREVHDALVVCLPAKWDLINHHQQQQQSNKVDLSGEAGSPMGHLSPPTISLESSLGIEGDSTDVSNVSNSMLPVSGYDHYRSSLAKKALEAVSPRLRRVVHEIQQRALPHRSREDNKGLDSGVEVAGVAVAATAV